TAAPDPESPKWPPRDLDAQPQEGTYIVVGEPRMREFAEYLASNPETRVFRLLLSDSAVPPLHPKTKTNPTRKLNASLSSLSYLAYTCPSTFLDQDLGFPNLTHLTLGSADVWQHQDALFRLRSLNYLHCAEAGSGFKSHNHAAPSLAAVLQALPHLTHLRVSGVQREEDVPALPGGPLSTGIGLIDGLGVWLRQAVFGSSCRFSSVQYQSFVRLLEERARAAAAADAQWVRRDDDDDDDGRGSNLRLVFPLERAVAEFLANGEEGGGRQETKPRGGESLVAGVGLWAGGDMPS
ncbi:hypothetical protein B0H13DRAFT_1992146, partial [Mycena leptocephala]